MAPRILIIEDNAANAELMSYLLTSFGYAVEAAADGGAGVAAARGGAFDLIICDVHLPVMDGYEVARWLKSDRVLRRVPLVAVTALAMVGDRERVLAAGFDDYVRKPIDPEEFIQRMRILLPVVDRVSVPALPVPDSTRAVRSFPHHAILVVDNLDVNIDLARSILEPHGYLVLAAGGMEEAIAVATSGSCDLILSDVCMAGASGYDLIRAVKADERLRRLPFIFITSTNVDENHRAQGLKLGAANYLTRPIEPEALLAAIDACLLSATPAHGNHPDR